MLERCAAHKLLDVVPDQLTVNQYESGQGERLRRCDSGDSLVGDTFSDGDETTI